MKEQPAELLDLDSALEAVAKKVRPTASVYTVNPSECDTGHCSPQCDCCSGSDQWGCCDYNYTATFCNCTGCY